MRHRIRGVSAVVCNYDGEDYLEDCLRSVLDQEGLDEVLVVDDASTDGSLALIRARFPEVRVVSMPRNSGTNLRRAWKCLRKSTYAISARVSLASRSSSAETSWV